MEIVNFFYALARMNKDIASFVYGKGYNKGAGNNTYPLIWLDDPILYRQNGVTIQYTVNVDILDLPKTSEQAYDVQTWAFSTGLQLVEYVKKIRPQTGTSVDSFTGVSLRDYYDDNAAGHRFTFVVIAANPVDRCVDNFDPAKQFPTINALPDFRADAPDGCAIFNPSPGLPNFNLKK